MRTGTAIRTLGLVASILLLAAGAHATIHDITIGNNAGHDFRQPSVNLL